jgi:putative ABC transport system substrate-binding protein
MRRREFIAGTSALLIAPGRLLAQGARRRLGLLATGDGSGKALNRGEQEFVDALRNHGWIDGKNLTIETRFSQPPDRLSASVGDLIALGPDVLVTVGPLASTALKSATVAVPTIFVAVGDPVALGLVQSLSRPGGNITGLATMVPDDFLGKRFEVLREMLPSATKMALLCNPKNPLQRQSLADPRTTQNLGVTVSVVEATTPDELDLAFASAAAQHVEGIIDYGDALTFVEAPRVIALAAKHRLPANYLFPSFAAKGGLSVYGPEPISLYHRAADYVDKILKGTRPSDLPVERPTKFVLAINMKTAKALGLVIPTSLVARADEVIE